MRELFFDCLIFAAVLCSLYVVQLLLWMMCRLAVNIITNTP